MVVLLFTTAIDILLLNKYSRYCTVGWIHGKIPFSLFCDSDAVDLFTKYINGWSVLLLYPVQLLLHSGMDTWKNSIFAILRYQDEIECGSPIIYFCHWNI